MDRTYQYTVSYSGEDLARTTLREKPATTCPISQSLPKRMTGNLFLAHREGREEQTPVEGTPADHPRNAILRKLAIWSDLDTKTNLAS
jgi:hypothetical protein